MSGNNSPSTVCVKTSRYAATFAFQHHIISYILDILLQYSVAKCSIMLVDNIVCWFFVTEQVVQSGFLSCRCCARNDTRLNQKSTCPPRFFHWQILHFVINSKLLTVCYVYFPTVVCYFCGWWTLTKIPISCDWLCENSLSCGFLVLHSAHVVGWHKSQGTSN